VICSIWTKELLWTDDTPKDAAIEVYPCKRTDKPVNCLWRADIRDIGEHPIEDEDLGDGRNDGGYHLDGKKYSRWDLHVMAEFEVRGEFYTLRGGDVTVRNEDHVCDGSPWENGTANELTDEVNTAVLICDSHDDADWDEEDRANPESEDQSIPWEMNWVTERRQQSQGDGRNDSLFNYEDSYCEHDHKCSKIPA
jgi:hypothetical protein